MPKPTLKAKLPDGFMVFRATDTEYKFLVAVRRRGLPWGAWRWSTRQDLAEGAVREFRRSLDDLESVEIVPVVQSSGKERRAARREWRGR